MRFRVPCRFKVSRFPELCSCLLDQLPRPFHVTRLGMRLAHAKSQREFSVETGVREIQASALIESVHELLVVGVSGSQAEADKVQRRGSSQFEAGIASHPDGELLREAHVFANVLLQSLDSVMPDHEPQLQRSKAASERDLPVPVVNNCTRLSC